MVDMKDQPDLGAREGETDQGQRQNPHEASWRVHLSEGFVEQHGEQAASRFAALIERLGARGGDYDSIRAALVDGLKAEGIELSPVEVDRYAERVRRGEYIDVQPPLHD